MATPFRRIVRQPADAGGHTRRTVAGSAAKAPPTPFIWSLTSSPEPLVCLRGAPGQMAEAKQQVAGGRGKSHVTSGVAPNGSADSASGKAAPSIWTVPTMLTVLRLFLIPPVVWLFGRSDPAAAALAAGVFVAAALTDWLDGYLARKWKQSSAFGAFLDPVADKLMVGAVLVLLCTKSFHAGLFQAVPSLMPVLSVIILSRELAMSSLREWAITCGPEARSAVAVNNIGKYKTALQMVSLSMLLYGMNGGAGAAVELCATAGPWLLIGAACLTVYSFAVYFAGIWRFLV